MLKVTLLWTTGHGPAPAVLADELKCSPFKKKKKKKKVPQAGEKGEKM